MAPACGSATELPELLPEIEGKHAETAEADDKGTEESLGQAMLECAAQVSRAVFPSAFVLMLPFFLALYYFVGVAGPLVSGDLTYGKPRYYGYQADTTGNEHYSIWNYSGSSELRV